MSRRGPFVVLGVVQSCLRAHAVGVFPFLIVGFAMKDERSKKVAIVQSSYIPWKGYFDMMRSVDTFVFLDDVQSTRRDWRTRNRIKTANGETWLTIPVHNARDIRICEVDVAEQGWAQTHWKTLQLAYARAPFMGELKAWLASLYERAGREIKLSAVNRIFIEAINEYLGITTPLCASYDLYSLAQLDAFDPTQRLVELCMRLDAGVYLSGPAAKSYLNTTAFTAKGIDVEWMAYEHYPEYPQLHGAFRHDVTILDLLLMKGPEARDYIIQRKP